MSSTTHTDGGAGRRPFTIGAEQLREGLVALAVASSFFVMYEPAPYDLLFILAIVLFIATGVTLPRMLLPFLLLVALYQIGALLTLTLVLDRADTRKWTLVGVFLAGTGVFYSLLLAQRTEIRGRLIANAWVFAGAIGGGLAIVGYFHLVPGADSLLIFGRAKATFKDPNVYAPYLIFPALVLIQRLYGVHDFKRVFYALIPLALIMSGIFLSFSRGSWGHLIASAAIMTALTILAAPTPSRRARIVLICGAAVLGAALLIAVLLSLPSVSSLFAERASLEQNYDVGKYGRFGRHIAGAHLALVEPMGIGIFQFARIFGADVHNSYLNAFMSYGWIGGVALPTLVLVTASMAVATSWSRRPGDHLHLHLLHLDRADDGGLGDRRRPLAPPMGAARHDLGLHRSDREGPRSGPIGARTSAATPRRLTLGPLLSLGWGERVRCGALADPPIAGPHDLPARPTAQDRADRRQSGARGDP